MQTISSWTGEPCRMNEVSEKRFLDQQDSVAQILRGKGKLFIAHRIVSVRAQDATEF